MGTTSIGMSRCTARPARSGSMRADRRLTLCGPALVGIGLLIIFSFSRRRGPVRDLPAPVRATPVEFLEALGSLYAEAGASATAVELAYERFRRRMGDLCGLKGAKMSAEELASALRRRFPQAAPEAREGPGRLRRGSDERQAAAQEGAGAGAGAQPAQRGVDCGGARRPAHR